MKSLRNSVQLIGRLGRDPEAKEFNKTKKVTFTLATNESYKNLKGEKVEDTQWHNIIIWGKLGDVAVKYLRKGNEVCIEGRLIHRQFDGAKGQKVYVSEVVVNDMVMLGGKAA